jgi:oligopeptidase B
VTIVPPRAPRRPRTVQRADGPYEDPYGWLRDRDDPDVLAHLQANNDHLDQVLGHLDDLRERLFQEIRSRVVETDVSVPVIDGPWAYYHRTVEGSDYAIHCRRPADRAIDPIDAHDPPSDEQVVLDENVLAEGHDYLAVGGLAIDDTHQRLAYLVDTDGNEEYALVIRDLQTGQDIAQVTDRATYGLAWSRDSSVLYYTVPDDSWRPHQVWRHRVGGPGGPDHDELVFTEADERFWMGIGTTRSKDFVVISVGSKQTSEVHLLDAHDPQASPRVVRPRDPGVEYDVEHDRARDRLLIVTNRDSAVDFQVVEAPVGDPSAWTPLVAHRPGVRLLDIDAFAQHLVLTERSEAAVRLRVVAPDASEDRLLDLGDPTAITTLGPTPDDTASTVRVSTTSLTVPVSVLDVDLLTHATTLRKQQEVPGYDPDDYVSDRVWATAPDGVQVPISLVRRRDTPLDGTAPIWLYGYGAYEIASDPEFSPWRVSLLDRGFVYAIAHVRGGGEMGRAWYEQGRLEHKPTTFTDFIACADHLVDTGVGARDRMVIMGGSAGGLLIGAVLNLRPDLCRAAIAVVPFVDVLSTMSDPSLPLTVPEYEEWGDPNDPTFAAAIRSYSPVDNVRDAAYPAILATGGLNDPRVSYWEPAKWVEHLRDHDTGGRPILLKTELGAGHGGPSGRYDAWRERALFAAFALDQAGGPVSDQAGAAGTGG